MKLLEIITLISLVLLPSQVFAAGSAMGATRGDGKLSLYNYHADEYLEVTYRKGPKYLPDGIKKITHLMRSRGDGTEHPIDLRLIELIDAIEDHFGAETIEVISGYRSPAYNRSLSDEGRNVARESLHTQGLAADIHIDEVRDEEIFDYVKGLGIGGAGFYPKFAFVHIDAGEPRTWREAPATKRILVGVQNNPNPAWSAVTDKDIYARGETLSAMITNNGYKDARLIKNVWIERFRRGKWCEEKKLVEKPDSENLSPSEGTKYEWMIPAAQPFGKYRLVIFTSKDFSIPPAYSNEFYVKR